MEMMTIGQVAQEAGVQTSTLRYYESIGILPPPARVSGHRRYTPQVLKRLAIIQVAKEAGFTLPEIQTLLGGFSDNTSPSERWKALARKKLPQVEVLISRAQGMKQMLEEGLVCDCLRLDECVVLVDRQIGWE
jgi:MerR family transcriptional regulator, redox-sensitive transcriptional activator SoxR